MQQVVKSGTPEQRLALAEVLEWMVADGLAGADAAEQLKKERRYYRGGLHPLAIIAEQKWKKGSTPLTLELEVILRRGSLQVADRNSGVLQTIPATTSGPDVARLSQYLEQVKGRFPDKMHATLLVANDVDYDTIVQVMDAVSVQQRMDGRRLVRTELFPQIALGDAPT